MSTRRPSPADQMRAATRAQLIEAALALVQQQPAGELTHERIAAHAGISPRTAYRHFPSRADLTLALWQRIRDTTGTEWPRTEAAVVPAIARLFAQFEATATLTRAVISAAAHTGHAVHGSAEGRAAFRTALADLLAKHSRATGDALIANCLAIYSAPYWQMLRDRGQLSPAASVRAAQAALGAVLAAARASVPPSPPPATRSRRSAR